jgi:hypothetical protein
MVGNLTSRVIDSLRTAPWHERSATAAFANAAPAHAVLGRVPTTILQPLRDMHMAARRPAVGESKANVAPKLPASNPHARRIGPFCFASSAWIVTDAVSPALSPATDTSVCFGWDAFRKRRCLIPADGFYEWMKTGKAKQPFSFRLNDDRPFAFAGLWERWEGPSGPLETCCILTTEANDLVRPAHDRMPVMLERPAFEQWLDPAEQDAEALAWMRRPYRADAMRAYSVSPSDC